MDEEQKELPTPPRFRYKLIKISTLTLLFLTLFLTIGFTGLKATSSSSFCSTCHEMKPEYYTWKASAHSEVDCVECHIEPGAKNLAKDKANGLVQVFDNFTNRYTAPIQMPKDIPNSSCERCHNMKTRQVTPEGDLIIPHDKHLAKGVKCVECHNGVAHGDISARNVTFKSDYDKWDTELGKSMMSDITFTQPKMEDCMNCHQARGVSTACKTCHTTGMVPKSHKQANFKTGNHGKLAEKDILYCNKCHSYMSDTDIKDLGTNVTASQQFLSGGKDKSTIISAQQYAKENTFCKKCHSQKPPSHVKGWVNLHGPFANKDRRQCLTCHDEQNIMNQQTTNITCSSCHPAMHDGKDYKSHHPIDITGYKAPAELCYSCHNKSKCQSCHTP
ncbi:MAG: NapC/NirT family cytochrome c [Bacillota bacterium]|nr:NapC/NirT family cytochrome c [Bacillota bacterium]